VGLISSAKSPVLIELIRLLGDSVYRLDSVDDVELYEDIVFAVGHQHSTPDFHERRVPEPDDAGALVRARLGSGWFAERGVPTPQAWHRSGRSPRARCGRRLSCPTDAARGRSARPVRTPEQRAGSSLSTSIGRLSVIETPDHYRELVMRYPRLMSDGRVLVDWLAAAAHIDAVRLTAAGLVFAQNVRVPTPYDVAELRVGTPSRSRG
jgi:hypothetical protein